MTRAAQHNALIPKLGFYAVKLIRELGAGKYTVKRYEIRVVRGYILGVRSTVCGKLGKNTLYLRFFFGCKLTQFVICLYRGHRLNEKRGSGG